jgi:hypothetical protein
MSSWRSRASMALTMLAVVLIISVPAMADDVEVECDADGGFCKKTVSWDSDQYSDQYDDGSGLQTDTADDCFPFCGVAWWP